MNGCSSFILSGPKADYDMPKVSFGKYLFDCLKKRNQDDVVIVDAITGEELTVGKLLEDSVKFTSVLKSLSIEKGDAISIISENTLNYFVPLLSSLYTGVVVCLLNPAYLTDELMHGLQLCKPKLVICSERTIKNVLGVKEKLEFIETVLIMGGRSENHPQISSLEELLKGADAEVQKFAPLELNCEEDGACILLSSGTTGLPKGVLLTHQNLKSSAYLKGRNYINITPSEITLLVLPYFHLFGFLVQLIALTGCMKVVLLDKFKPDVFLQSVQDYKVTKLFMVPPMVLFLAKSPLISNYDLSSVREILCGAAALGKDIQIETMQRLRTITIRQLYGLTETGGPCTFHSSSDKPGCVGTLIPDLQAKVYNLKTKKSAGPSEIGELCFKGPMIMKCYVGNSTATEESFDEDGFYHTGDIGYYEEDGCFYIVDRLKELIKYKGFQVAPAELEALIITHPAVKDCGVIGIPDERAGQLPRAYVVRQNGTQVTEQDIIDYVARRISIQKHLYGGVRFIDEIPKSPSGKILRRKLQDLYQLQD